MRHAVTGMHQTGAMTIKSARSARIAPQYAVLMNGSICNDAAPEQQNLM